MEADQLILSKETRKVRKAKKFIDEEEPTKKRVVKKTKFPKKKKSVNRTKSIFIDEASSSSTSTQPITPKNKKKQNTLVENDYDSIDEYNTDELIENSDIKTRRISKKEYSIKTGKTSNVKMKLKNLTPTYDLERVQSLTKNHEDDYWKRHTENSPCMIKWVNREFPLKILHSLDHLYGSVLGMTLSEDGSALATFSIFGSIYVWDLVAGDFKLVRKLRDESEPHIEEFYCGAFKNAPDDNILLAAAGKLKNRHKWCDDDDDNQILPCPIKIFDLLNCRVVARLEGHEEEILCIKAINFDNENYYISTSQDGYIIKWHMESDWFTLKEKKTMGDGVTCMAFTVSFLPNTGNKYFLGACDADIKLYDFEEAQLMQVFENIYSSYCDCGKFIKWTDEDEFFQLQKEKNMKDKTKSKEPSTTDSVNDDDGFKPCEVLDKDQQYAWFISRGAEWCDVSEGTSSIANSCTLHRLIYPKKSGDPFKLEEIRRYKHEKYLSNSWLIKIASNGKYIFAPTTHGQFFSFNLLTGQVSAIIKEHEDIEVRDILVHPNHALLFSSGDDGRVFVYTYDESVLNKGKKKEKNKGNRK